METVVFLLIVSIITIIVVPKFNQFLEKKDIVKLKSELALINQHIVKLKNKSILLQDEPNISRLDSAKIDLKDENLFDDVVDFKIKSTNSSKKEAGFWAKLSNQRYVFYTKNKNFDFNLEDNNFICVSSTELCESLE